MVVVVIVTGVAYLTVYIYATCVNPEIEEEWHLPEECPEEPIAPPPPPPPPSVAASSS